jgi:hypothetical protein
VRGNYLQNIIAIHDDRVFPSPSPEGDGDALLTRASLTFLFERR